MATTSSGSDARTPLVNMRGIYTLIMPWSVSPTVLYTCKSLQSFTQIVSDGIKGYEKYYKPMGLTEDDWTRDLAAGAYLCGLFGDDGSVIYVPDVYIQRYPDQNAPQYSNFVLSALIGPLPSNFNFNNLRSKMAELISDTIGMEPEVFVDTMDNSTVLTPEEANAAESARLAQIKNRTTTYAQLQTLQQRYTKLEQTANDLAKMVTK